MRAALFDENGGPEVIYIGEAETPSPGPGESLIRVLAAGLNHLDLWLRKGLPIESPMPHIGGSDVAGIVEAVGPGGDEATIGTRVVVDPSLNYAALQGLDVGLGRAEYQILGEHTQGGFAEYVVAPDRNLVAMPDDLAPEVAAAAALNFVTAWRGLLTQGRLAAGERVLITGCSGGVSTAAVQIARLAGGEVYAITSGPDNVERVKELGAHKVYDRLEGDFGKQLWADTKKQGVHVILDSVGEALWPKLVRSAAMGGRIVTFGATTGPKAEFDLRFVFWRQISIIGSTMGTPAEFRAVMNLVFRRRIEPVIHAVLPLDETRRAHELLEAGEVFGKLVIRP